jgi:hypothetical protein
MQPNIKRHGYGALTLAVLISGGLSPASAQNATQVALSADLEFKTRYLFAGIPFSTGEVAQAAMHLGYGTWTFHVFTNYDFDMEEINEGDVWGDYYHQFNDKLGGFVGGAVYNFKFSTGWDLTPELYGGLVLYVAGTPTLYYARDFDLTTGDHTVLTLTHGIPAGTNVTVQATGRIEYNNGYYRFDPSRSSFSYADLNIAVPIALEQVTFTPWVALIGALADDFEDDVIGGLKVQFALR